MREWKLETASGVRQVYEWDADKPWCMVQIVHGMAEHMARYDGFAKFANAGGITVFGMDIAGHGKSVGDSDTKGYFADRDALDVVLKELHALRTDFQQKHPDVPYVLMGHSMGSLIARNYAMRYGEGMSGLVLSGTSGGLPVAGVVARIAQRECGRMGAKTASEKLDKLGFGSYNKRIRDARTKFDWLSRDPAAVDAYVADENCGFLFTAGGFADLLTFIRGCTDSGWADKLPKGLPVLLFSGKEDPAGGYGKGVSKAAAQLRRAGVHTTCVLYEGARHEMLNETNRDEVMRDIADWLKLHIIDRKPSGESKP